MKKILFVLALPYLLGASDKSTETTGEGSTNQIGKDKRLAQTREASSILETDALAQEYRTCLNRHANDNGSCADKN